MLMEARTTAATGTWTAGLAVTLIASIAVAVAFGPADLSAADVTRTILAHLGLGDAPLSPARDAIVWELRVPRALTAVVVGAGLAVCGVVMQSITRNPLADPYLLGLSSGASFGAVLVIVLGVPFALAPAAFLGSGAAMLVTLLVAGAAGVLTPTRTILAGLAVSAVFGALTSLVIFLAATGDTYREILGWLLGSLAGARWESLAIAAGAFLVLGVPLLFAGRVLDAFAFGDRSAAALGIPVEQSRWVLLGACAVLTGALVSVSGAIGFVGLVLPHAVRLVVGAGHRALLPLSALAGGLFLLWADTIARTVVDPRELPVGVVTALVGGPVFAALLLRRGSAR